MKRAVVGLLVLTSGCLPEAGSPYHCRRRSGGLDLALFAIGALASAIDSASDHAPPPPEPPPPPRPPLRPRRIALSGWVPTEGPDQAALAGALVRFRDNRGQEIRALTDRHGEFRIPSPLQPGAYQVTLLDEVWEGQAPVQVEEDGSAPLLLLYARPIPRPLPL